MRLPAGLGWDSCSEITQGRCMGKLFDAWEKCSGSSYQEVLGNSSSDNTTAHRRVELIVVSMGRLLNMVYHSFAFQ